MEDCESMLVASAIPIQTDQYSSVPDGKVCLNNLGELAVTKFAVEPVSSTWKLRLPVEELAFSSSVYVIYRFGISQE